MLPLCILWRFLCENKKVKKVGENQGKILSFSFIALKIFLEKKIKKFSTLSSFLFQAK